MNYGMRFMTLYRRQGSRPSPWKRNAKSKMEALQIAVKRREVKSRVPRTAKRDKKAFFSNQCKEIEEKNRMGKTRDLFKLLQSCPNLCNLMDCKIYCKVLHTLG